MQPIARKIHKLLLKKQITVATAESCTAGMVSKLLTDFSGSSAFFLAGISAYSNQAKERILRIPRRLISQHGAVSAKIAMLMAQKIRQIAGADFGIGITGIAGPAGGSAVKPTGTVFIAIDSGPKKICQKFIFKGDRGSVRKQAAGKSLELLSRCVSGKK
jgi:PncC family amidohydrolase